MTEIRIDFETRSDVDLRKHGAGPYFESPHFRVLIAAYSIDNAPIETWAGGPCPRALREAVEAGATVRAFNASFERRCFGWLAARGWPLPRLDRFRCTAAEAAAMGLPRSLDGAGEALGLAVRKDKRGAALIRKFSVPRKARKGETATGPLWHEPEDHPDEFAEFVAYCAQDVAAEAAVAARVVPLSDYEQAVYALDQTINDRGIRIDRTSALASIDLAEKAKTALDREMAETTDGHVTACSQLAKLITWVEAQGVPLPSAARAEIASLLDAPDLPGPVRRALLLRQEAAKTSVSKLKAMLDRASSDGRVRSSFLIYGAGTGRWSSLGVNFANMPRPRKAFEAAALNHGTLFESFRRADPDLLRLLYGDDLGRPLDLLSDALRGFVWAAPGHDLLQADYSGIEGAVIAWLAGEDWKLTALHEIAADPSLPDLYRRTAAAIMGTTTDVITKKHPLRQSVGKVAELALGFSGGVSAFHSMARAYAVDLDALHGPVWDAADPERRERAERRYASCLSRRDSKTDVMSRNAWIACEIIKIGWRESNPAIAGSWKLLEEAIRTAVQEPGTIASAARVSYLVKRGFLWCLLPSGRCLAYGAPRLQDQVWVERLVEGVWADAEVMERTAAEGLERLKVARIQGTTSPRVTALGVNSVNKKWERFALYGGLAAENNTQATARDLLVNGMLKAEAAGYPIIAHVYDEIITEVPRGWGDVGEFERLICALPEWAAGLPLTASGWRGKRYRKD